MMMQLLQQIDLSISSIAILMDLNTGRVEVYASDILTRNLTFNITGTNSGGNLVLTGANFQNDSVVGVGVKNFKSKFTIFSNSNYYSLQNTGDDLDRLFTTPIRDATTQTPNP